MNVTNKILKPIKISILDSSIQFVDDSMLGVEVVLYNIYVAKKQRGYKLGYILINLAIEEIKSRGYKSIFLEVEPFAECNMGVDALIKYYRGCGFEKIAIGNEMYLKHWGARQF
jgi:ribosomal protein S18 acetylase RimI-like enzyme